ncbi:MAG: helix-turn-helix transcriptional regulator [Halanaeroarchaeum sp.]
MKRVRVTRIMVAVVAMAAMTAPLVSAAPGGLGAPADVNPDAVHLAIELEPNGSAHWTVEYRVKLDGENETQAFESLVADVRNNSSAYVDRFASRINATVADAETQTGRSMRATDFTVTADIRQLPQTYGVLTYTFTWHGFATTDGDTIRAGDALRGFFLDADTTLLVSWPDDYRAITVEPSATDRRDSAVTWVGPLDFASGEPTIVIARETGTQTSAPGPGTQTTGLPEGSRSAWLLVAAVFAGLVAVGIAAVWYYRHRDDTEGAPVVDVGDEDGVVPTPSTETDDETPEELLSNEERVKRFLEEHGGRAKQQEIVEGLDWTEAKTSQVLSEMHDAGDVDKFRIGRENVVKLPDEDESG